MSTSGTTTSFGSAAKPPETRLVLALGLLAAVVVALAVGWLVHHELFVTPRGEFLDSSVSPSDTWKVSLYYISFGAGATTTWRADVARLSPERSEPRDIYVGGAGVDAYESDMHWVSDDVIVINGHRVDVTGPGYGEGPVMTGLLWLVYWLVTVAAGIVAAVIAVAVILVCRAWWWRRELRRRDARDAELSQ